MRLMRFGGKKSPYYRIVISDSRSPRDGRFIEQVGTYDPKKDPAEVRFKEEKAIQWLKKGVQPTLTVRQLLIRSGISKKLTESKKKNSFLFPKPLLVRYLSQRLDGEEAEVTR